MIRDDKRLGWNAVLFLLVLPQAVCFVTAGCGVSMLSKLTDNENVWRMWVELVVMFALAFYAGCAIHFTVTGLRCMRSAVRAGTHGHEVWSTALRRSMNVCAVVMLGAWPASAMYAIALWEMW